jgi:hypothetical protein
VNVAWVAIALCAAGWFALRWAEETERINNIWMVLSVDLDLEAEVDK